jgi:hypothetical protein
MVTVQEQSFFPDGEANRRSSRVFGFGMWDLA